MRFFFCCKLRGVFYGLYIQISHISKPCEWFFSVRSEETHACPTCKIGTLCPLGRRRRAVIGTDGIKRVYLIWRLQCPCCHKIHHELPDFMIPFKLYTAATIEAAIEGRTDNIPCGDSTIYGFRQWFLNIAECFIVALLQIQRTADLSNRPISSLLKIKLITGCASGWLKKAVCLLVYNNQWIQTRLLC